MRIDTSTPHVADDWTEAFLLELRLRGVDGRRAGEALAEVEAHCAESGESAREAFGDPAAYAVALAPTAVADLDWRAELGSTLLGLGGMLSTLAAAGAWQTGARVEITTGIVAMILLLLLGITLVVRRADLLLRAVVRHWWVAVAGALAPIGLFVVVLLMGQHTLVTLPATATLAAGVAMLAANTALALLGPDVSDPVVGPEGAGGAGTMNEGAVMRGLQRLTPWLFPGLTAVMALPMLLL